MMSDRPGSPRLPVRGDRNVAVRATPDAVRQLRGGSQWLFDGSIDSTSFDAAPGTIAIVFDRHREFVAVGLYDPDSPIRVRVLQTGRQTAIDAAFFAERVETACLARLPLFEDESTDGYRLINGENDRFPGLVVDRYADTVVIKVYSTAWLPWLYDVAEPLLAHTGAIRAVARMSRAVQVALAVNADLAEADIADGVVLIGPPIDAPIQMREYGLTFQVDVVAGQKTGHFLDQRENRHRVRALAAGCSMLDVFSATGGFAVSAAAGGARSVHLIDISERALHTARTNFELNRSAVAGATVSMTCDDAFDAMRAMTRRGDGPFDLIVVDPPAFAQNQAAVPRALGAYARLTTLALGLLRPGGAIVLCSCSSRVTNDEFFDTITGAAAGAGRPLRETTRTFHALDHPVRSEFGGYLKALFAIA